MIESTWAMASCDLRVPMLIFSMVGVVLVALRTVIMEDFWLSFWRCVLENLIDWMTFWF
jgi:hypothetical protein